MTQYEERHLTALQQIGYQLENLNRNISKFGFTVLPTQDHDESKRVEQLYDKIHQSREQLYEIIQQRTDELEAKNEEIQRYRAKIHAYEKQLKELTEGPEPAKEIYRGMEVAQFGAK